MIFYVRNGNGNGFTDCHIHGGSGYFYHGDQIIPPPDNHYFNRRKDSPTPSSDDSSPALSLSAGRSNSEALKQALNEFLISSILGDRCPELNRAIQSVRYIAAFTKEEIENNKAKEDWKFVAMVLDRLFLWIFSVAVIGKKKTLLLLRWFCSDNWQINPLKLCNSMIKLLHFDPNYVCFTTFLIWSQIKSLLLFNQKTFL